MGENLGKQVEKVKLTVQNIPGVLDRIVGHIRHEGWNIKSLNVDETEISEISYMEINIEGTHSKLAQVASRLLNIDNVISVTRVKDNKEVVHTKPDFKLKQEFDITKKEKIIIKPKEENTFRILTVNPGSTSTKFALYDNKKEILVKVKRHTREELDKCGSILNQKTIRLESILDELNFHEVDISTIDAIAGRGGLLKPIESGTYLINEEMLKDLNNSTASVHASSLGAIIASEFAKKVNIPAFVVDPIVVDEMDPCAKITGMPGIDRSSVFHALNQKAIARRAAKEIGKPYENTRLVVVHLGGGITVGAHRYGRVIDVNDALSGEGPFTPERTGCIPAVPLIKMCFSGEYSEKELIDKVTKNGGMRGYLGTNDLQVAQKMINDGDEFAALVVDSMAYQVCKEIGAMTVVLEGRVDGIILTGGLSYSNRFTGTIKQRVDNLAPIYVYPGEDEMVALMSGVLRVLKGEENTMKYI